VFRQLPEHGKEEGCREAADYIKDHFKGLGLDNGTLLFSIPILQVTSASILVENKQLPIHPMAVNAITPPSTGPEGISGEVIYAGPGRLIDFDHKPVDGSIVLMELDSGKNWSIAANLGARALIFIDRGGTP